MSRECMDALRDQVRNDRVCDRGMTVGGGSEMIQPLPQSHGRVGAVQSVDM